MGPDAGRRRRRSEIRSIHVGFWTAGDLNLFSLTTGSQDPISPDEIQSEKIAEEQGIRHQQPRVARGPGQPTKAEEEEHKAGGHVEYRSWCVHCIRGRARDCQHRSQKPLGRERLKPIVSWDYCFPGDSTGEKMTILVGKCPETKAIFAHCCKSKGLITPLVFPSPIPPKTRMLRVASWCDKQIR